MSKDEQSTSSQQSSNAVTPNHFLQYSQSVDDHNNDNFLGFGSERYAKQIKVELHRFMFVLLTVWDNILGPQISRVWVRQCSYPEEDKQLINYVNMHVLTGDNDYEGEGSLKNELGAIKETKLLFLAEQGIVIFAVVFTNRSDISTGFSYQSISQSKYKTSCLSFVFPYNDVQCVTPLYNYLSQSTKPLVNDIIQNADNLIADLTEEIHVLSMTFNNLLTYSLTISQHRLTYLDQGNFNHKSAHFLKLCFQGVLQCGGYGLIVGKSSDHEIMKQISILLSFVLPQSDLPCTLLPTKQHTHFMSYIYLQSLNYEDNNSIEDVRIRSMANEFPIAIIDVTAQRVKCSSTLEKFLRNKYKYFSIDKNPIEKAGKFVDTLIDRMIQFRSNPDFLKRLGALTVEDIRTKSELFIRLYEDRNYNSEPVQVALQLKWEQLDADIFIAWACRNKPRLKRKFFSENLVEIRAVL